MHSYGDYWNGQTYPRDGSHVSYISYPNSYSQEFLYCF